jgi:RHS repeat-associated protein
MGCLKLTYRSTLPTLKVVANKLNISSKSCAGAYRYGFQGQEKDDEISGAGNSYTASFWQYDSRLGRRWNLDPKPNPSISEYATFANNPIRYMDVLGDTVFVAYDGAGLNHTLIIHVDNETGIRTLLTEGMPQYKVQKKYGSTIVKEKNWGNLEKFAHTSVNSVSRDDMDMVNIPDGMNEDEFVKNINKATGGYKNNIKYEMLPELNLDFSPDFTANSNSLVGSVLRTAGSNFEPSRYSPGFDTDVLNITIYESKIPDNWNLDQSPPIIQVPVGVINPVKVDYPTQSSGSSSDLDSDSLFDN